MVGNFCSDSRADGNGKRLSDAELALPDIISVPLYHVTFGMGFPPPDSQSRRSSSPSLNGPNEVDETMSPVSGIEMFRYLGSAATNKRNDHLVLVDSPTIYPGTRAPT